MRGLIIGAWLATLCAYALADGLSEYAEKGEFSRVFRPADIKVAENRQTKVKNINRKPTGQIIYGKPHSQRIQPTPFQPNINRNNKFKPSPEDPYFPAENAHYAPGHKYLQKYAQQLYAAQKNAGYLSEYQKYIINQDPEVKKYVLTQPNRTGKQITEQTPQPTKIVTTTVKPTTTVKTPKKIALDSTAQSTGYKYVFKPEYIPVYTHDKDVYSAYENIALTTVGQQYTPKYASAAPQYILGDHVFKLPSSTIKYDEHEYTTDAPKYEFKYEVKDPEKNSNFGHAEARNGKATWGKYYVQLSDGRLETVKYWADKTGYHAEVDYKGQARHPAAKPKEQTVTYAVPEEIKIYGPTVTPQFYAVSEHTPVEY